MEHNTLLTISKRTGFSTSTVSRVLNGQGDKYRISKKTIQVVSEEAKKCHYTPSLLAKGLRMRKTQTIGLLLPGIDNPYFASIASVVIYEAKKLGYTVVLVDTMEDEKNEQEGITSLLSRKVDGIIIAPCGQDPTFLENTDQHHLPVILIDRHFESTTLSYVCTDNYRGGYEATQYLTQHGHKDILCIRGLTYAMPSRERARGYLDALKHNGLTNKKRIAGNDFSIKNGYLETKLAINTTLPTAIFAMSNTILLGAIKAIREAKLKIPKDISIVSFDNYTYLDYLDPAITRISQPESEIGTMSVMLLVQRMESSNSSQHAQILLPPQLITGNSVKKLL
ncbi:LacI family transcriptional regulator [Bacteroidia bacterium]|nr:LacI family transcriptional regulator [Bacteroidia bacterium]